MRKTKDVVLQELNKSINVYKTMIERLKSIKVNKTKNGEYFKTINKKGFEILNKEYCDLYFETYDNKYCLKYYSYYAIYFKDYAELETKRDAEIARLNKLVEKYEKEKEYASNNYESFLRKIYSVYKSLNDDEIELLKNIDHDLYLHLHFFN